MRLLITPYYDLPMQGEPMTGKTIRLPEVLMVRVQKEADRRKRTFSDLVRIVLEERFVRHAAKKQNGKRKAA